MSNGNNITVRLSGNDLEIFNRPVIGEGGMQDFLRELQQRKQGNQLTLTKAEINKIRRYAEDYGEGGFQQRFQAILNNL